MQEHYMWNQRVKRLTPAQIRKMKENMKKVPLIQKKAEQYHDSESLLADELLNRYVYEEINQNLDSNKISWEGKITPLQDSFFKVWKQKIKNFLFW